MGARACNRAYGGHAEFYRDVYGRTIKKARAAGRTGAPMTVAEQTAGERSDAPSPDLVVAANVRAHPAASLDLGAGRFRAPPSAAGGYVATPWRSATSIAMDGPRTIRFAALPFAALLAPADEGSGSPHDGDFGPPHTGFQRGVGVTGVLDRLRAEARAGGAPLRLAAALLPRLSGRAANRPAPPRAMGGLAPWQVRRACDRMAERLDGDVGLAGPAALVGVSTTHFARPFRRATGAAPDQWRRERRR